MKWSDVEIIDNNNILHNGRAAAKFVKDNCPDAPIGPIPKAPTSICLFPGEPHQSVTPKDIRKVLFNCLSGKAKSMRISTGEETERVDIPVAKKVQNVIDLIMPKLKVEFIYKQDPRSDSKIYLKDHVVSVTADFLENAKLPVSKFKKDAHQGVADLGSVYMGRCRLTPDYSRLDECKFDYDVKPIDISLASGDNKTVTFEVEPLYQQVQLIAHCLQTVPDYKFVLTDEDKEKVEVRTEPNGIQNFEYKTADVQDGFYDRHDLSPPISSLKAKIESKPDGSGTLTLLPQKIPNQFWALDDLTLDGIAIEEKKPAGKNIYNIKLSSGLKPEDFKLKEEDSKKANIAVIPSLPGIIKLTLLQKTQPLTLKELENVTNQNLAKLEIEKAPRPDEPSVHEIQFKPKFKQVTYKKDDIKGGWKGKYHGLKFDKDDIAARVKLVETTLNHAYPLAEDDPTIIKVFMVPECFFQGRYGAYLINDPSLKNEEQKEDDNLLFRLLNLVGDVKWRDWMFVFGTVNLTFGEEVGIREMMNYSPVIRGGLGPADKAVGSGGEGDKRLRLLQKLTNSAELLDKSTIIHYPEAKDEVRTPSVNEDVQFQANQSEEEVGRILRELLDKARDFGVQHKLSSEQWAEMKSELEKNVSDLGLTRVVRLIRNCKIDGKPDNLPDWGLYSGYEDKTKAHLQQPDIYIGLTTDRLILDFIEKRWKPEPKPFVVLNHENGWQANADRRKLILSDIKARLDEFVKPFEITLSYQKEELRNKIQALIDDDTAAIQLVEIQMPNPTQEDLKKKLDADYEVRDPVAKIPPEFGASIYPMWKKILELYCKAKDIKDVPLTPEISNLEYRDYCFAAERKAGTWLTFEDADKLKTCKKLIFGLEICADHADGRLKKLVQEPPMPEFDETLIEELKEIDKNDPTLTSEEIHNRNLIIKEKNNTIKKDNQPTINLISKKRDLESRNENKPDVIIDIQLVPSAGMRLTADSIVARKGGYGFNCDGWSKGIEEKGDNVLKDVYSEGPLVGGGLPYPNPLSPHTGITKGGYEEANKKDDEKAKFALKLNEKLKDRIDAALYKDIPDQIDTGKIDGSIFSKNGPGELHIYEPLDLPKD